METSTLETPFQNTRQYTVSLCHPLQVEDCSLQAAAFVSPPKWHLAHTAWFFETFLLKPHLKGYQVFNEHFEYLFNSYYNAVGRQFPRPQRGLLSRPALAEVYEYRDHVDAAMIRLLQSQLSEQASIQKLIRMGMAHEQQHQELILTDIKFSFYHNPFYPAYLSQLLEPQESCELTWLKYPAGLYQMGMSKPEGEDTFAFDNEYPQHPVYFEPFALANRLVTNREYQAFIDDGGYQRPEFWLADGWDLLQREGWQQPLYWQTRDGVPLEFTLYGLVPRQAEAPVTHICGYEADAFAAWAGARLPTEFEWELAASRQPLPQTAADVLHPQGVKGLSGLQQLYNHCWQWTGSAYRPYPGYRQASGAVGEYNGKFMCNQWVLRGSSCATSAGHSRLTYRNFFYPQDRWQFSGIRLANSL